MHNEKKPHGFLKGLAGYAAIMLLVICGGLWFFWKYIAAFEASRPTTTASAWLQQHPLAQILDGDIEWFSQFDSRIQSDSYCREYVKEHVAEPLSCLKDSGESTEEQLVFRIRSGKQTIGKLYLEPTGQTQFGFMQWEVSDADYDFSFLEGDPVEITVPAACRVLINDTELQEQEITEKEIHYPLLEEFYDSYTLPTLVRYRVEHLLGQPEVTILDENGNVIAQQTDVDAYLQDCGEEDAARVQAITSKFLSGYVKFCGSGPSSVRKNFSVVAATLVPDGALLRRLHSAISGMEYGQSGGDKIDSVTVHRTVRLSEERFLCDITYVVSTKGKKGVVQTTMHMKVIAVEMGKGLRIEAMTQY